jgi:lipopolysaccharide/colanic/teichoic acid biosynthesis glycosyltransferase
MKSKIYPSIIKRIIDILLSSLALLILSPIFITCITLLYFTNDKKVFFLQLRPGQNEKLFYIIKFKTMNDKKDSNGELLPDNLRITRTGKIIRNLSLDELPQLINVLIGNMSIIGPRPLLPEYIQLYNDEQRKRHFLKPGISGWAQVNGRNTISWKEKFEFDNYYIKNVSFIFDLKIIFMTVIKIFRTEGINQNNDVTMEKFTGNE